ncbi:MAG: hypothetical protein AAGI22_27850 [Planctomycetota bacterium]
MLGASGRTTHADLVAPRLVDALRSNAKGADACMATEGLVGLGIAALPYLDAASDDEQQRLSMEAIRLEILDAAGAARDAEDRAKLNVITTKYKNAAHEWRYRRSYRRSYRVNLR